MEKIYTFAIATTEQRRSSSRYAIFDNVQSEILIWVDGWILQVIRFCGVELLSNSETPAKKINPVRQEYRFYGVGFSEQLAARLKTAPRCYEFWMFIFKHFWRVLFSILLVENWAVHISFNTD